MAYSVQPGPVDNVRSQAILTRRNPPEVYEWAYGLGIKEAHGAVRLPHNQKLGMLPRVVVPVRCQGVLLGFMWVLDPSGDLSDEAVGLAEATAQQAGILMYAIEHRSAAEKAILGELIPRLLEGDESAARAASAELVDRNLFVAGSPMAAVVVRPRHRSAAEPDDVIRASIARAVERLKAQTPPRHVITTVRSDHALVLTSAREVAAGQGPLPLAKRLRDMAADALGEEPHGWEVCVGIGEVRESLSEAAGSYREAKRAAELAEMLLEFGHVVPWSQLGIYKLLAQLPPEYLSRSKMHPGLVKLFEHREAQVLVETLECFLDLAGDVKETSSRLVIHRATLYYRLGHIEEIAEVSMRNGEDRLAVHLGLKLARLGGFHPSQVSR